MYGITLSPHIRGYLIHFSETSLETVVNSLMLDPLLHHLLWRACFVCSLGTGTQVAQKTKGVLNNSKYNKTGCIMQRGL